MSISIIKRPSLCLLVLCVLSFQGCDQIQKFTNRLTSSKKTETAIQAQPQTAQQVAPAPTEPKTVSMENVVVRVGNWFLTKADYDKRVKALQEMIPDFDPQNKEQVRFIIQELLQQQLFVQDALRKGLDKDEDMAIAVEEFRNSLLAQKLAAELLKGLSVSPEEAAAAYEEFKENFTTPFQWRVREIVVKTEEEAQAVLVQLNQGSSFADVARQKSVSPSAPKGGDLGFMALENFEFEKMAQSVFILEPGQTSNYFKGPAGFYIVKVESKTGGVVQPYDKVRGQIEEALLAQKQQEAILKHLEKLEAEIPNQINEKLLGLSEETAEAPQK